MIIHALYPHLCSVWGAGVVNIKTAIFRIVTLCSGIKRYFKVDFYPEGGGNRLQRHVHSVTCQKTGMLNSKDRAL
jgi:hypothetical protein